uniref:Uncharacterized protein n=1 Tax=Asparagus officinalis TaxID=4686 RepID=Q2AA86_ASPOF|nr:hypothetical protein 17.t00014 [Asparagus officinalis]
MNKSTFSPNKLETTVGANSLVTEAVVPQPTIKIRVTEEVEYEFDQQKFEEYISSSSSRSASPRKRRRISFARKIRWFSDLKTQEGEFPATVAAVTPHNNPPVSNETKSTNLNSSVIKELTAEGVPTLSRRARQRQRQHLARQFAKALDQVDGRRYQADLEFRKRQNRSTLEKRIQKHRALLAHAQILPSSTSNPAPSAPTPPVEPYSHVDLSRVRILLKDHLDSLPEDRGRVPVKEHLGPLKGPQANIQTRGRTRPPNKLILITARLGKKTCQTDERVIPENSCKQPIYCPEHNADELYYRARGTNKPRKKSTQEADSHCPCIKLIRTVSSACNYPKSALQRVSVFQRLSSEAAPYAPKRVHNPRALSLNDRGHIPKPFGTKITWRAGVYPKGTQFDLILLAEMHQSLSRPYGLSTR